MTRYCCVYLDTYIANVDSIWDPWQDYGFSGRGEGLEIDNPEFKQSMELRHWDLMCFKKMLDTMGL